MVDRLPIIQPEQGNYPERSDEGEYPDQPGWEKGGGPPRRDKRRSRSLGQNISAVAPAAGAFIPGTAIGEGQLAAWDSRTEDEEAETIVCYLKCYDFAEGAVNGVDISSATNPFSGVADTLLPVGVKQSLIMLAEAQWGHDGVNKKVIVNLSPGQIIKVPFGMTYARAKAKVSVKYFPRITVAPGKFTYLNLDPNLANNIFNAIGSQLLTPDSNFDPGTVPTTPIHVEAIMAKGVPAIPMGAQSDRSSRAVRKFFGTLPASPAVFPAVGSSQVSCPIAFGASSVLLQTSPANFQFPDPAAPIFGTLKMGMVDSAGNVIGEIPANQFVPLIDGCQQVFVYNTTVSQGEVPFTIIYDMGL